MLSLSSRQVPPSLQRHNYVLQAIIKLPWTLWDFCEKVDCNLYIPVPTTRLGREYSCVTCNVGVSHFLVTLYLHSHSVPGTN